MLQYVKNKLNTYFKFSYIQTPTSKLDRFQSSGKYGLSAQMLNKHTNRKKIVWNSCGWRKS